MDETIDTLWQPVGDRTIFHPMEGINLERSALTDWVGRSAALLEPLADAIDQVARQPMPPLPMVRRGPSPVPGPRRTQSRCWRRN